jgi:alcohol dehydrogenase
VTNESALMLADILPTAYEVGARNGKVGPGDAVVVVGAGPIGLAAITSARLFSPSTIIAVDPSATRRDAAIKFGASSTVNSEDAVVDQVLEATGGAGADVVIEAVGIPATFELCTQLVRPGGHIANIGVHGSPATLHLESLWSKNVTITTGLVDTYSTATLLRMVAAGQIDSTAFVTHRFGLDEMLDAYDVFANAVDTGALKVALFRT